MKNSSRFARISSLPIVPAGWRGVRTAVLRAAGLLARSSRSAHGRAAVAGAAALLGLLVWAALHLLGGEERAVRLVPRAELPVRDPLEFDPERQAELERAAALGLSHVLYVKSPGGVLASARRTARFRPLVEAAAAGSGFDADTVEAIVFLESAGRPEVIAGDDPARAAGLTQILAETGVNFLGMRIDLEASRRLARRIAAAKRRGDVREARRLRERRRRVDPRFDPAAALAGTVRYLSQARARFGRDDLAIVSYHMGIANLEGVLRAYARADEATPIADVVAAGDLSYARVFFDSSPIRHGAAWTGLARLGDGSRNYYWKVLAAREIMRLFREDRPRLTALAELHGRKASAEEVLHPPGATERFAEPADVAAAWQRGELQPLPNDPRRFHFAVHESVGELAPRLGREPALYRGLRPEAVALVLYLAGRVYEQSGEPAPLVVTSAVRDEGYQRLLSSENVEATRRYSLHATGYAFDILRRYGSDAQAGAFQFELERLEARGLIAWAREPAVIHITVASEAAVLVPALLREAG